MSKNQKYYYKVYLEVALKTSEYVFGYINISHISYERLGELFRDQITFEDALFDDSMSYFIEEELYKNNKDFFDNEIPFKFDFNLFEYSVGLSSVEVGEYKKDYYEELPPPLKGI